MNAFRILAINPGSTSTKIAVFEDNKVLFTKNIKHKSEELAPFHTLIDQYPFRKEIILKELREANINIQTLNAVIGRGGLVKPIPSGVYEVNHYMLEDLRIGRLGQHASNLGGILADDIARLIPGAKAFIADPVVVDELNDVARFAGHPKFERISIFHALNQKAIARMHANAVGKKYEELNLVVAHLGGGISVGAHKQGKVIDVNNALDGEGPFSPERTGTLPVAALAKLCFSGEYTLDEIKKMITGKGGFVAYLNTNDAYEVEQRIKNGDEFATKVHHAMAYQVGKTIAEMSAVLHGNVDAILLTGGIAYDKDFVDYVKEMVSFIAPVVLYPGEDEMKALAMNALMVMRDEIKPKEYK
jgi:butyrate kinase